MGGNIKETNNIKRSKQQRWNYPLLSSNSAVTLKYKSTGISSKSPPKRLRLSAHLSTGGGL